MQHAVVTYIVQHLLNSDQTEQKKRLFSQLNVDRTGQLSLQELEVGFRKEFGEQVSKDEISQIFNMMDINRNGKIDYTEWVAATLDYDKILKSRKIETAFEFFDKQNRKKIGIEELKKVIGSKRKAVEDQVYLSIISEVDRDGDFEIDLQDFY